MGKELQLGLILLAMELIVLFLYPEARDRASWAEHTLEAAGRAQ
jgi:hypothetical protein